MVGLPSSESGRLSVATMVREASIQGKGKLLSPTQTARIGCEGEYISDLRVSTTMGGGEACSSLFAVGAWVWIDLVGEMAAGRRGRRRHGVVQICLAGAPQASCTVSAPCY